MIDGFVDVFFCLPTKLGKVKFSVGSVHHFV